MRRSTTSLYRFVAGFLVMTVLTSGIAMAGYVCPQTAASAQAMEMMMAGQPCAGMDKEKPVHCAEFQSGAELALEHLAAPPALTPVVVTFIRPVPAPPVPSVPASAWNDPPREIGADPPYLRTLRLRI